MLVCPFLAVLQAESDIRIEVKDPQKWGEGMSSYITYRVETQVLYTISSISVLLGA